MSRLTVERLSKAFGDVRAARDLTFAAEAGSITGLLGPNGSGKTTTLRILLGLVRADSGRALISGRRYVDLERPITEVGAVLEATAFHPACTARNHLRSVCLATGLQRRRVGEVLELAELTAVADRPVGRFSLGLRQRLALATAIMGRPKVLIVDEPANGLDPSGIRWLRAFLRQLADTGVTVLVSSHVLSEVEQTVDHAVIIADGRLVRDASLAELRGHPMLRIRTAQVPELTRALERAGAQVRATAGEALLVSGATAQAVAEAALAARVTLTELTEQRSSLEEVFVALTEGT